MKTNGFEVLETGEVLVTVTFALLGVMTSDIRIMAIKCPVAGSNEVVRALPLKETTDVALKFVPIRVRLKPGLPA